MVENTFDLMNRKILQKANEKAEKRKQENDSFRNKGDLVFSDSNYESRSIFKLPSGLSINIFKTYIDPSLCKIWEGNNRLNETRNDEDLEELKEQITAQGQLIPGFVRPIVGDGNYKYEVIYGSRRLSACTALNKEFYTMVGDISEKDALILMDAENNARKELSLYEKALSYSKWLKDGYFKNTDDLAMHLGVSREWISRVQSILKLPKEVLNAFERKTEIKMAWVREISRVCKISETHKSALIKASIEKPAKISNANDTYHYLMRSIKSKALPQQSSAQIFRREIKNKEGNIICEIYQKKDGAVKATFSKKISLEFITKKIEEISLGEGIWEF